MKSKIFFLAILVATFACKDHKKTGRQNFSSKKNKVHLKHIADTLFVSNDVVLVPKLDSLKINNLKKKYNENYQTIIDDAIYYRYEASEFLKRKSPNST